VLPVIVCDLANTFAWQTYWRKDPELAECGLAAAE
jgi:hypothetical protein